MRNFIEFQLKNNSCIVFLLFALLHLLVIISLRIYPFIDLPNHLASATIFKLFGEPTNDFSRYFYIDLKIRPNLFHLIFCGTRIFPSIELANKIFYCTYILLVPLSIFLIVKKIGGNIWYSLLSFLFIYNYSLSWAFTGFTISIPIVFIFIYMLIKNLEAPAISKKINLSLIFLLLFFLHIIAAIFALIVFLITYLYVYRKDIFRCARELFITIPFLAVSIYWWINSASVIEAKFISSFITYYSKIYIDSLSQRGMIFFLDNAFLYPDIKGRLISCFFSLVIVLPFCWQVTLHGTNFFKKQGLMVPLYVLLLCALFAIIFIPDSSEGIIYFWYQRFTVFFYLSIIIIYSALLRSLPKITIAAVCLVCFAHLVLWVDYYRDFAFENKGFTESFFPENMRGKKLAGLMVDNAFRGAPVYLHFPSYYIIWKQGIATTSLIDSGFGSYLTTKRKVSFAILPLYDPWVRDESYCKDTYKGMDFLLIREDEKNKELKYCDKFNIINNYINW